ncbi:uncharacterized protein TNIN_150841 [Trichonephila inaurata madagascariensis]|uniref:Uncharacterized protein n=1 Tax=Trichonephila inaurata madagascariensis TaxID=2747483 RepID=A0A8X6Y272_9ARAC|nr:uncharacterized protein TNIN_150841 [Trichonephila inaurata madagascariensis]
MSDRNPFVTLLSSAAFLVGGGDWWKNKLENVDPLVLLWLNQTREDDLDKGPGQRVKRRRRADRSDIDIKKIVKDLLTPVSTTTSSSGSSSIGRKRSLGDESSPEVSSSNISPEPNNVVTTTGVSPVPSLAPSDIGEVDLEFWDLDINESSNANTIASTSVSRKKKGVDPFQLSRMSPNCEMLAEFMPDGLIASLGLGRLNTCTVCLPLYFISIGCILETKQMMHSVHRGKIRSPDMPYRKSATTLLAHAAAFLGLENWSSEP